MRKGTREGQRVFQDAARPRLPDGRPARTKADLAQTRSSSWIQRVWGWLNRRGWR